MHGGEFPEAATPLVRLPHDMPTTVSGIAHTMNHEEAPVLDYLTSGVAAGMFLPDAADSRLHTIRVVKEA